MSRNVQRHGVAAEVERQLAVSRVRCRSDTARPAVALTLGQWRTVESILSAEIGQWHQGRGINPERGDTGFMVVAAVRYSLGRPSQAASLCTGWLQAHWTSLRERDRADIVADIERHLAERAPADGEGNGAPWGAFLSWARTGWAETEEPPLAALACYRLGILARAPRAYAPGDAQIQALQNRGLVEPTGRVDAEARREWTITDAGRAALERQS
ncbi:hypothetical protein U8607_08275 [Methylobacterium durans]|uniref:hypothetical protein n=1 Tax=Methylobacterium durans TaxID=2202825 RepID=UPI002AFE4CF8|nr:hypothetical protein [Methylobacterium durans]MEA1832077.1 hypothetical protein [Methylobacterium durans]